MNRFVVVVELSYYNFLMFIIHLLKFKIFWPPLFLAPEKQFGEWKNVGNCVGNGKDPTCGPGIQNQTRTCKDGTTQKCKNSDMERQVKCLYAQTELPMCKGSITS